MKWGGVLTGRNLNSYGSHRSSQVIQFPNRNMDSIEKRKKQREIKNRKIRKFKLYSLIVLICLAVIILIAVLTSKNGSEVFVGDKSMGQVKGKNLTAEYFINTVEAQLETSLGSNVQINEKITAQPVHVKSKLQVTDDYMVSKIKENITYKVEAAVINVDSMDVVTLKNKTEAEELLQSIIDENIPEGSAIVRDECGFVENVQILSKFVDSQDISLKENAYQLLTNGTEAKRTYSVQSGDSLYKIAQINGTTVEALLAANPSITLTTGLKIGQELNLTYMKPYLSVKTIEYATFTEKAEKTQEIRYDNTKDSGYRKVIQQGKDGQKEVTTQIIRVNGFEEEQKVVSEKITQEPVNEIIVVGTK